MSSTKSSAETLYQEGFELVKACKLSEAVVPLWKGLEASVLQDSENQQRISFLTWKCRAGLLRCGASADAIDDKILEIRESKKQS
jgi:hypothetical protein